MKINRSTLLQWTIPALKLFNPLAIVLLIKRFWNIIYSLLSKIFIGKTKSVVDIQLIDKTSHKHIKIELALSQVLLSDKDLDIASHLAGGQASATFR